MGAFRLILALSVVAWHLEKSGSVTAPLLQGRIAVIAFYIVSGFYMAMVITDKYARLPNATATFYKARVLRLFPAYLLVLAATILLDAYFGVPSNFSAIMQQPMPAWQSGALWLSNVSIFGLDAIPYLGDYGHGVGIVAIAWTLAIELQFYLIAPFLVTRPLWVCIAAFAAALAIRFCLLDLNQEIWRYYFAPSVWCFFLLGVLGFRLSRLIDLRQSRMLAFFAAVAVVAVGYAAEMSSLQVGFDRPGSWAFYVVLALAVPFVFEATKNSKLDSAIGNVTYPLYLVHLLVIGTFITFGFSLVWGLVIPVAIGVAVLIHVCLEWPFERWRALLGQRAGAHPAPPSAIPLSRAA